MASTTMINAGKVEFGNIAMYAKSLLDASGHLAVGYVTPLGSGTWELKAPAKATGQEIDQRTERRDVIEKMC